MPFNEASACIACSSGMLSTVFRSNEPFPTFRAKSCIYSAFRNVMPKDCSRVISALPMVSAITSPNESYIRCHIVACAFVEICCPMMWWTTEENRSVSTALLICPIRSMQAANFLSLLFRYSISFCPYSKQALIRFDFRSCLLYDMIISQIAANMLE